MHLLLRSKHIAPKPRIARAPELVSRISGCLDSPVVTRRHYFSEVMGSMNPLDLSFSFFFFLFSFFFFLHEKGLMLIRLPTRNQLKHK